MFEVTSTGKNEKYGKEGERIKIRDTLLIPALKNSWIGNDGVCHVGNDTRGRKKKDVTNATMDSQVNG
jgi:hypothetical protein